jgi:HrpA-like RNA helicase
MSDKIGILDPLGVNNNPLTSKPYSEKYKELAKKWKEYPAYKNAEKTIAQIVENQVILIVSGTGSGKTVLMPKFALHSFNYDKKIAIVLPKQIIAKSAATFSALTLDVELGTQVGYKYRGSKQTSDDTKLLYTTDGTIVSMLMNNPMLPQYNCVIIDEAHERRTQTDFLLYLLKETCLMRKDFKLIIMSATIDKSIFKKYFEQMKFHDMEISVKPNYPIIDTYFTKQVNKYTYVEKVIDIAKDIIKDSKTGDILIFVPTIQETFTITSRLSQLYPDYFFIEVYGGINQEQEDLATDKDLYKKKFPKKTRKIVVATNVAESSLTIDGIQYVIDSGYENLSYFDPDKDSRVMVKKLTSKAQIKQRCGRTGRTGTGMCYHVYTKNDYLSLDDFPQPSIKTSNIYAECLQLMAWEKIQTKAKLGKVLSEFIEPPTSNYIDNAMETLEYLKLIKNGKITKLGEMISNLPVEPKNGLAIYAGYKTNTYNKVIAIVVLCEILKYNINDIFDKSLVTDPKREKEFENIRKSIAKKNSDHYTLAQLFFKYRKLKKTSNDDLKKWIKSNHFKERLFIKANKYYKKMKRDCLKKIKEYDDKINTDILTKYTPKKRTIASFYFGYTTNIAKMGGEGYYTRKVNTVNVSKDSFLYGTEKRELVYSDMMTMGKTSHIQINSFIGKKVKEIYKMLV